MELTNEFRVGVPVDRAWEVLTDVELIAPCLPGAQLTEVDGETYHGQVKVKVGPITAQYKGSAHFIEKDDVNHRAVLDGTGRDTRGQGNASAIITAQLTPDGDGTKVDVTTELKVTGKVAQFGRGVLADVSAKLLGQFVDCLEGKILVTEDGAADEVEMEVPPTGEPAAETAPNGASQPAPAAAATATDAGPRRIEGPEVEPVDLLDTAGVPVAKRAAPLALVLLVLIFLLRRRRG
ncbi:MAG: SRPBCC family protein [Actinomycetota bacterium]